MTCKKLLGLVLVFVLCSVAIAVAEVDSQDIDVAQDIPAVTATKGEAFWGSVILLTLVVVPMVLKRLKKL